MPEQAITRSPLPKLSPLDEAIFEDLSADADFNLAAIAAKHKISASLALERITAEPITAYLAVFERFVSIRENARQSLAISRLTKLMDSSPDLAEQRRAATAVLQASFKLLYPPRSRHASTRSLADCTPESAAAKESRPSRTPLSSSAATPPRASAPPHHAVVPALTAPPAPTPSAFGFDSLDSQSPTQPSFHTAHAAPHSLALPISRDSNRPRPRPHSAGSLAIAAGAPP